MRNYGEALKYYRELNGYSQNDLSKITGITQAAISYWERNKKRPNIEACELLADLYGISIDELIGREGYIPSKQ